jgi:HSP20 family molecular chaperone IbpA
MLNETKTIEVEQDDILAAEPTERIRDRRVYVPRADIYENKAGLTLVMDVPGADEQSVDITLEKNVLTINAYPAAIKFEEHTLAYSEFSEGDYQRSFALSNEIDSAHIAAEVKNGVLTLHLPKVAEVKPQKISIKGG